MSSVYLDRAWPHLPLVPRQKRPRLWGFSNALRFLSTRALLGKHSQASRPLPRIPSPGARAVRWQLGTADKGRGVSVTLPAPEREQLGWRSRPENEEESCVRWRGRRESRAFFQKLGQWQAHKRGRCMVTRGIHTKGAKCSESQVGCAQCWATLVTATGNFWPFTNP